jgi:hypothetical protein
MTWRAALSVGLPLAIALGIHVAATSCQPLPEGAGCVDIPTDGCPIDRGGSCEDPTCHAIYNCNDGKWSLAQICPDGGTGGDVGIGSGTGTGGGDAGPIGECLNPTTAPDGGPCPMANFDLTGNLGPDQCTPDLQLSCGDCPYEVATGTCTDCICVSGCLTFYVCANRAMGMGWYEVGYCTDDGQFFLSNDQ